MSRCDTAMFTWQSHSYLWESFLQSEALSACLRLFSAYLALIIRVGGRRETTSKLDEQETTGDLLQLHI